MAENLVGQVFNYFTVIDGPIRKNKKIYWHCKCQCGNEKEIRSDELKSGRTKSCGCYKKSVMIEHNIIRQTLDLTNQRFGKLIAKEKTDKRNNDGRVIWNCLCDCGRWCEANTHDLQQGKISSCGCMRSKGEATIEKLLQLANLPFEQQKIFYDCKFPDSGYHAKFDFYVNNSYIIEYDGEQHYYYKTNPHTWNTQENYIITQQHDKYKNDWCKEQGLSIIRIPYTKLDTLCIADLMLDTSDYVVV